MIWKVERAAVLLVALWLFPGASAAVDFTCPEYPPLIEQNREAAAKGSARLNAFVGHASLDGQVKDETKAVYDAHGDAEVSLIKYSMLVMLCKSVRDNPALTADKRTEALINIQQVMQGYPAPAALAPQPVASCAQCLGTFSNCTEACQSGKNGSSGYCAVANSTDPSRCCACEWKDCKGCLREFSNCTEACISGRNGRSGHCAEPSSTDPSHCCACDP